jgi:uncharacterized protein YdcH (DUF465 family)
MEAKEEKLIRSLMDSDPELRKHYEEHVGLKRRLEELRQKPHLTPAEEMEQKRIQKQKLAGKDKIMEILAHHKSKQSAVA